MTKCKLLSFSLSGAGFVLLPLLATADTIDVLMRQLRAKGVLTEREYTALQQQRAAEPAGTISKGDTVDKLLSQLRAKGILNDREFATLQQQRAVEIPATAKKTPEIKATTVEGRPPEPVIKTEADGSYIRRMDKGIGIHVGPVDVSIAGSVNAFYVHDIPDSPSGGTTVQGGLANVNRNDSASVRNGLLPGNFTANIKTRQRGYDIGVTFGLYPGLNSVSNVGGANSAGNPSALGTSGIDFRQQFLTIGNDKIGTFKGGRDIGVFGSDAILNDFSLLSVGSPGSNVAPSNTALGRIGLGYVYTDFIPQMNYTTPEVAGLKATIGVFSPLRAINFSTASGTLSAHDQPGFHGKVNYKHDFGKVKTELWGSFITQQLTSDGGTDALPNGSSVRAYGFDGGGKFGYGPATLTAYGYYGSGLGSTGLFFDAVSPTGRKRDSYGFYVQGTYQLFERLTIGVSHGASYLDLASGEVNPLLVDHNESQLIGFQYKLTEWVKLVAEYVHTHSRAHGGNGVSEHTVAAGTVLFF